MVTFFAFQSVFHFVKTTQTAKVIRMKVIPLLNKLNGVIKSNYARKIQVKQNSNDANLRSRIQGLLMNTKGKTITILKHPSFSSSSPQK